MLFYDNENVDAAWCKAKHLYRNGMLPGVRYIRSSTIAPNIYQLSPKKKVIFFYAGPADNESAMKNIGTIILRNMQHTRQRCDEEEGFNHIYFKDEQQRQPHNHLENTIYKLPLSDPYSGEGETFEAKQG